MRNYNALGLVFANMHDEDLRESTAERSMGSLPFGGRYRLMDFVLSNMVNAGITKVGVITKSHYHSLMDHLGSGKAWDLSRKNEGLFFLPPRSSDDAQYQGRISPLADILPFLRRSKEEIVILSDCHMVANIDYQALLNAHLQSGADVTVACTKGVVPSLTNIPVLKVNAQSRVTDMLVGRLDDAPACYGIGIYVMGKAFLMRMATECVARNLLHFERDVLQHYLDKLNVNAYEVPSLVLPIFSPLSYFNANLALLDPEVRQSLFPKNRPVYTKIKDCDPVQYGLNAQVTNSMIADGAHIDGTVKNCIIFRGVHIGRGAHLENCVVMQDSMISDNCNLRYIIADKNVVFRPGCTLQGSDTYPVYIEKNAVI